MGVNPSAGCAVACCVTAKNYSDIIFMGSLPSKGTRSYNRQCCFGKAPWAIIAQLNGYFQCAAAVSALSIHLFVYAIHYWWQSRQSFLVPRSQKQDCTEYIDSDLKLLPCLTACLRIL